MLKLKNLLLKLIFVDTLKPYQWVGTVDSILFPILTCILGQDLPATELQPADDFALLAAQAYVSLYRQTSLSRF